MRNKRPEPPRPIAKRALKPARWAAGASAAATGFAVGLGIFPDAWATGGLHMAVPLVLAAVVTIGLCSAWHMLLGYAAYSHEHHERSIALAFGVALFIVGAGCSGWFAASLIGGHAALQSYRFGYVERLKVVADQITGNATLEAALIGALDTASGNLAALAEGEGNAGLLSGRAGRKLVYLTLKNASASFAAKSKVLSTEQASRAESISLARDFINDAVKDAAAGNAQRFEENTTRAATNLGAAANIRLSVADLGIGLALNFARQPIEQAVKDVAAVMGEINNRRQKVDVPTYQPIDAKTAVVVNPQALPWIAAIVIELLPLIFLGLLLTIWRDEADDDDDQAPPAVAYEPRARPTLVAGE